MVRQPEARRYLANKSNLVHWTNLARRGYILIGGKAGKPYFLKASHDKQEPLPEETERSSTMLCIATMLDPQNKETKINSSHAFARKCFVITGSMCGIHCPTTFTVTEPMEPWRPSRTLELANLIVMDRMSLPSTRNIERFNPSCPQSTKTVCRLGTNEWNSVIQQEGLALVVYLVPDLHLSACEGMYFIQYFFDCVYLASRNLLERDNLSPLRFEDKHEKN